MQNMKTLSISENKGAPRVWLQGRLPELAGFVPGARFRLEVVRDRDCVALRLDDQGRRRVCSKKAGAREVPVIDLNSNDALGIFSGLDHVRVVAEKEVIYLLPLASEARTRARIERLRAKMEAGAPLDVGSLSHGGGVLSLAIHEGMQAGGVKTQLAFANDIRDDLLEQAGAVNPAWSADTVSLAVPMQELAFDQWAMGRLGEVDLLEAGLPCEASSRAGRAKNGNVCAEAHERVGHLAAAFLAIVARVNPAVVVLENVVPYQQTASAWIIRHQLRDLGYDVQETILSGAAWGALENRERLCLVAVTRGLPFDLSALQPAPVPAPRLADVLEPIPEDSPAYRPVSYLKVKEVKDKAAGKGFAVPYLTADAARVPTLRKGYHKGGSCDARLLHPTNPELSRLLTATENARCKGIPECLISGLPQTTAHELLGQSILFAPFRALGALLAGVVASVTGAASMAAAA